MKRWQNRLGIPWFQMLSVLLFCGICASCSTADSPVVTAGKKSSLNEEYLNVGDKVKIIYSDIPNQVAPTEQQIPANHKIVLHLNLEVDFVGKTKTELEKEIRDLYINRGLYKNINIAIEVPTRPISIGGEVKSPSTYAHQANLTLTKAINMAGGFTEYAKRTKIHVIRADGTKFDVNYKTADKDPAADKPIYPGDRIHVDRTIF